jgi:hypothetical protein
MGTQMVCYWALPRLMDSLKVVMKAEQMAMMMADHWVGMMADSMARSIWKDSQMVYLMAGLKAGLMVQLR